MADVPLMENPMTTGGDVIYGGASGAPTRLANGSNGQVLTSAGGTSAPTWETPSAGSAETWEDAVADLSGKVHRWKFEEASGDFADSIASLTLVANGSISYQAASPLGYAASFTGGFAESSGVGSIPTGDNPRTILIVWKKTAVSAVSGIFPLFSYGAATTRALFQVYSNASNIALFFSVSGGDGSVTVPVADGGWHLTAHQHLAATLQTLGHYQDGFLTVRAAGGNLATSAANNFHVAAEFDDSDAAPITVADVIVFDRWLAKWELDRLYRALVVSAS